MPERRDLNQFHDEQAAGHWLRANVPPPMCGYPDVRAKATREETTGTVPKRKTVSAPACSRSQMRKKRDMCRLKNGRKARFAAQPMSRGHRFPIRDAPRQKLVKLCPGSTDPGIGFDKNAARKMPRITQGATPPATGARFGKPPQRRARRVCPFRARGLR